jgi:hypothetical protein
VISDRSMAALRGVAALVSVLPQLRVRVCVGDQALLDVTRGACTGEVLHIPPCAFRSSVARAHARRLGGQDVRFLSLPAGVDPEVVLAVPTGDEVLPGGMVRAALGGVWVHLAPVALDLHRCLAALGELCAPDGGTGRGLATHHDRDLDVTVLHAQSPLGDLEAAAVARDLVETGVARCAVADLEDLARFAASVGPI